MSNEYYNFYYDPVRQGYDSDTWSSTLGVPVISNNYLILNQAYAVHFADLLRCEVVFSVNIETPVNGMIKEFGLVSYNKNSYIKFNLTDDQLTVQTSPDGGNTENLETVVWNADWSSSDIEFKIKWEAGKATFYINNEYKWSFSNAFVPNDPLSVFVSSEDAINDLKIKYIDVTGIQSYNI